MPPIGLLTYFFVALCTFVGAVVVPYVIIFGLCRRVKTGCGMLFVYGAVGALLGFLFAFALRFELEARLMLPPIQEALDAQCGAGVVVADPARYSNNPFPAWYGVDANCQFLNEAEGWECFCPE